MNKRRVWFWIAGGVAFLLIAGLVMGGLGILGRFPWQRGDNRALGSFQLTTDNLPPVASTVNPNASPVPAAQPIQINSLADLRSISQEIVAAEPSMAQARADQLWRTLVKEQRVPLIFDQSVVFLYMGQADRVDWRGDFNTWTAPGLEGKRIGQSDLWIGVTELPSASRADYRIVINDKDWLADPVNPHTTFSGLTGVNSIITMPGFTVTDESQKRNDVRPGKLTSEFSITSTQLGYAVNYWVYTPLGYENLQQLPVLYVLDGNDFVDERMGAMPTILDNLIADKRIEPIIAVFINARDPNNPQFNRREEEFLAHPIEYAQFIADELVPLIDRTYRTNAQADARVIAGVSYGGLSSSFIAASRPNVFHNGAAFSPAFWPLDNPQALANQGQRDGSKLMAPTIDAVFQCGGETGFTCPRFPLKIFASGGLPDWDVGDLAPAYEILQQQGYPVDFHQVREGHGWDNWRGLTDEMLIYFFGSH